MLLDPMSYIDTSADRQSVWLVMHFTIYKLRKKSGFRDPIKISVHVIEVTDMHATINILKS